MLLSAVSVLVVAQSSSEIPEGLMNNPVNIFLSKTIGAPPNHPSKFLCVPVINVMCHTATSFFLSGLKSFLFLLRLQNAKKRQMPSMPLVLKTRNTCHRWKCVR